MTQHLGAPLSPCSTCFQVSFYWREGDSAFTSTAVPEKYFDERSSLYRSMKVKDEKGHPRCTALQGEIGKSVHCEIYENRPSPCKNFNASFENGGPHEPRFKRGLVALVELTLE